MKRRSFGVHRRVWWPKWTPASSSCFMVTTATGSLPRLYLGPPRPSRGTDDRGWRACEFSERAVTRARVAVSVPEACSRQPLGLDPVGPREPHCEDQAPRAHAEPDREAAGVVTPDDPTRRPVEDHDPPAVGPEDERVRREDHTGLEDRHPERRLPPGRAAPGVDERDRPEVVGHRRVAWMLDARRPPVTRALIYTRVSQDRKKRGRSVAEQEAECRAVCEAEGWHVLDVLTDNDRSASRYATRGRPAWDEV